MVVVEEHAHLRGVKVKGIGLGRESELVAVSG